MKLLNMYIFCEQYKNVCHKILKVHIFVFDMQ